MVWKVPKFLYANRYIKRSPSESSFSFVPDCCTHAPPPHASLNGATAIFVGPLNVEFPVFAKSTWNFQRFSEFVPKFRKNSFEPLGGTVAPSKSAGSNPPKLGLSWKQTAVAAVPAFIAVLFNAQARPPTKEFPLNMLKVM